MSVVKNWDILSPNYLPDILPHRESQTQEIANNLSPASKGRKPQNTFIFGAPGIGKTASVNYVFREFEEYSGIKTIYINCWDFNTPTGVLTEIVNRLGLLGTIVQRRGWAKDEIMQRFNEAMNKIGKAVIVCLDEVDQLVYKDQSVLYDLLRMNAKNPLGLVFISNDAHVFAKLEPRILSSLNVEEIEFKPYTIEEMKDILQERARNGLRSFENGVVMLAANHAVQKGGDVRVGIQTLMKAATVAEEEGTDKLKVEHVKQVLSSVGKAKPEILKEKINDTEKIIMQLFDENKQMKSTELYDSYRSMVKEPISDRAFRDCISHLEQLKLIHINKKTVDGNTRIISKA
ncbi:AAA family ATPase [archaeon]|nr:MAG: AAA family ATPase [archaeon]